MGVFGMTEEEKVRIREQHLKLEKDNKDKKDAMKKGLLKPIVKKDS